MFRNLIALLQIVSCLLTAMLSGQHAFSSETINCHSGLAKNDHISTQQVLVNTDNTSSPPPMSDSNELENSCDSEETDDAAQKPAHCNQCHSGNGSLILNSYSKFQVHPSKTPFQIRDVELYLKDVPFSLIRPPQSIT